MHAAAVVPVQPIEHRILGFADCGEVLSIEPVAYDRSTLRH